VVADGAPVEVEAFGYPGVGQPFADEREEPGPPEKLFYFPELPLTPDEARRFEEQVPLCAVYDPSSRPPET